MLLSGSGLNACASTGQEAQRANLAPQQPEPNRRRTRRRSAVPATTAERALAFGSGRRERGETKEAAGRRDARDQPVNDERAPPRTATTTATITRMNVTPSRPQTRARPP